MSVSIFQRIRRVCAEVADSARYVQLQEAQLASYAGSLPLDHAIAPVYDREHHFLGEPEATVAYVLMLDTVNFGSGYFPQLQKRPGMSGYFTVASSLKDAFEARGPFAAHELSELSLEDCAALFGQDLEDEARLELMELFAIALNDLGSYLLERFDGSFVALVEAAEGSAEKLVGLLTEMPYFQDLADYGGLEVPLLKRAQISASDLSLAFEGQGYGNFDDLDKLTIFADNLVPHVLRLDGLLSFDDALIARIEAGDLIPAGSTEEVEIRAVALHAVERLVEALRQEGHEVSAQQLDVLLWNRGQDPRYKMVKRHRTQTVFY